MNVFLKHEDCYSWSVGSWRDEAQGNIQKSSIDNTGDWTGLKKALGKGEQGSGKTILSSDSVTKVGFATSISEWGSPITKWSQTACQLHLKFLALACNVYLLAKVLQGRVFRFLHYIQRSMVT